MYVYINTDILLLSLSYRESCSEAVKQIEEVFEVLEEVVLNDDFGAMQLEFCKKNCHIFDSEEENKLVRPMQTLFL